MCIFHRNFFVLYNKLHNKTIDTNVEKYCLMYCRNSHKELIRYQIYLAENNIPFSYSDNISISELQYLLNILQEYLKEKNDSLEKVQE